jgi:hypothetical protein
LAICKGFQIFFFINMDISLVICGANLIVKQLSVVRQTFVLNGVIRLLEQQWVREMNFSQRKWKGSQSDFSGKVILVYFSVFCICFGYFPCIEEAWVETTGPSSRTIQFDATQKFFWFDLPPCQKFYQNNWWHYPNYHFIGLPLVYASSVGTVFS